jgi:Helicase associated domain
MDHLLHQIFFLTRYAFSDYPSAWHGVDLAGTVYDMTWWQMHVKHKPDRVAELNRLGFIWERLQPEWNLVLEALITYSSLHGNLLVPFKFVVPYGDDAWPKATWGIALGSSVYRIRMRGDFLRGSVTWSRREQLDALGFVWDLQEYRFRIFFEALVVFAEFENGRGGAKSKNVLRVPTTFVVPSTSNWPRNLWGYKLGEKCTAVRQKGLYVKPYPQRQKMLANIGFLVGGNASLGWLEVVHAAAVFSQMNQRNLDVPSTFVVPAPPHRMQLTSGSQITGSDDAWPWPGK